MAISFNSIEFLLGRAEPVRYSQLCAEIPARKCDGVSDEEQEATAGDNGRRRWGLLKSERALLKYTYVNPVACPVGLHKAYGVSRTTVYNAARVLCELGYTKFVGRTNDRYRGYAITEEGRLFIEHNRLMDYDEDYTKLNDIYR